MMRGERAPSTTFSTPSTGHRPIPPPGEDRGPMSSAGAPWAQVSATPFRLYKGWLAEGGIRSPLVVSGAGVGYPPAASTMG